MVSKMEMKTIEDLKKENKKVIEYENDKKKTKERNIL